MERKIKLVEVEITAHCHATENIEKVKKAILNLVPEELKHYANFNIYELEGHYGNPITRLTLSFRGNEAEKVLQYILQKLDDFEKRYLIENLDIRYDRRSNKLYFRVDKQEAYLGRIKLSDGSDTIRIIASFAIARGVSEVKKYLEELVGKG